MKRGLAALEEEAFDVLVVGGGISGACVAWDAALRGLSVALIEKDDFGHATSSASSKLIHGGVRYLQQGLLHRARESVVERRAFLRIAPHLVKPIPFLVPTYGHGLRGKELLFAGMTLYGMLSADRNRSLDPARRVPGFHLLSRDEALAIAPSLPAEGLTGGVVYADAQMQSSERVTLSFLLSAAGRGAVAANYVEATRLLEHGGRVVGVAARDRLGGNELEIRARVVVATTGPWVFRLGPATVAPGRLGLSKGIHLVTRCLQDRYALALATRLQNQAIINRGGRHLFFLPWRGHTLIGTTNVPFQGEPDEARPTERDVGEFVEEIGRAWPGAGLTLDDVRFAYGGLYYLLDPRVREGVYRPSSVYRIFDGRETGHAPGLLTVLSARFTTARRLAERCVDQVFRELGKAPPACATAATTLAGGDVGDWETFVSEGLRRHAPTFGEAATRELLSAYGSQADRVASLAGEGEAPAAQVLLGARVAWAVREEMAQTLGDVVFRRTGLGTVGEPAREDLETCVSVLSAELGWDADRAARERDDVRRRFSRAP